MQTYDSIMLVIVAIAVLWGAWKGLAWQIASLGSLVVAWVVAFTFSDDLAPYVSDQEPWNRYLAMLLIYLTVALGVWVLYRSMANVIEQFKLVDFDRQMGALIGLAKGLLVCLLITFFAVSLSSRARDAILQSRSGYYAAVVLHNVEPVLPERFGSFIEPYLQRVNDALPDPHEFPEQPPIDWARPNGKLAPLEVAPPAVASRPRSDGTTREPTSATPDLSSFVPRAPASTPAKSDPASRRPEGDPAETPRGARAADFIEEFEPWLPVFKEALRGDLTAPESKAPLAPEPERREPPRLRVPRITLDFDP